MQLFSSNVLERSVTISWARISTAWPSRPWRLTKSSLARTAAPAPSDVGLEVEPVGLFVGLQFEKKLVRALVPLYVALDKSNLFNEYITSTVEE